MKYIALLVIMATLSGCVLVPANKIKLGTFTYSSPKNISIKNLRVQITGTNCVVFADEICSENDPAVIDKTAAGQAAIIREVGTQVREGFKTGAASAIP